MQPFRTHRGTIAILNQDDVDTDRIIPARFLSMVTRSGYGELLFKDVRGDGFPLDEPETQGASVLVVGTNFGCGSSREHAVWAIQQAGFRAIVGRATDRTAGFSDIFRQNSANNGLLLIDLSLEEHAHLLRAGTGAECEIDLPEQTIAVGAITIRFGIHPAIKQSLMEGLDPIGKTLLHEKAIGEYESQRAAWAPPGQKKVG
jgi:3-isopropylmalate/(R)-2-methylmalate dehydratase small subunit